MQLQDVLVGVHKLWIPGIDGLVHTGRQGTPVFIALTLAR